MSGKRLNMRTFGNELKPKMSKTAYKKIFDSEKKTFISRTNAEARDASKQEALYDFLFSSLTYALQDEVGYKFPDLNKGWISQTLNNKIPLNSAILKAAQRKEASKDVSYFFSQNLIPNIPSNVLSVVVDDLDVLVQADISLGDKKRKSLKKSKMAKSEADYLADVWVLAVCRGTEIKTGKTKKAIELETKSAPSLYSNARLTPSIDLSMFRKPNILAKEFINRDIPRKIFFDIIDGTPPFEKKLLMYYGIGGIGKSSLVKNLQKYTKEQGVLYSSVDFDDPELRSPYKALNELKRGFNAAFPHFDIAVTLCFIKRNPGFSLEDIRLPNRVSREALRLLGYPDAASMQNSTKGLVEQIYNQLGNELDLCWSILKQLSDLEDCSAVDIEEQILHYFAIDLYLYLKSVERNKCVLFFDTYEALWKEERSAVNMLQNDTWVRTMVETLDCALFVLSGREKLQWESEHEIWGDRIQFVALNELESEYAKQYLSISKIEDEAIQSNIINAAKGHPFYLDLCVDTYYNLLKMKKKIELDSFAGGFQKLQERFFRSLAKSERAALQVLSVPRFYDYEIFEMLITQFHTRYSLADFDVFNSFSFIKHEPSNKYIIHVLMRAEITRRLSKDHKHSIDRRMIAFYEKRLSHDKIPVDDIRYYFSELLFHLEALKSQEEVLASVENEYIEIVKQLQISGETKFLLEQFLDLFNHNQSSLGGTEFFAIMVDMIHLSGMYREAVKLITEYLNRFEILEIAQDSYCLKLYIRRTHHQMFYIPVQTLLADLTQVVKLVDRKKFIPEYCEIMFMLGGHVFMPLGDFDEARKCLRKINNLARRNSLNGFLCRGLRKYAELLCAENKYIAAEKVCITAINIAVNKALWRYEFYLHCILGEIKRLSGKLEEALKKFSEVISRAMSLGIKGWYGHVNCALANCHTDLGNFELAFKYFDDARNIYLEIGQKCGCVSLESAYQRALLIFTGSANIPELEKLKRESDALGHYVISRKIEGLIAGDKHIMQFEYK